MKKDKDLFINTWYKNEQRKVKSIPSLQEKHPYIDTVLNVNANKKSPLKKKFCSEKMMIIALNTLDQPPKESKFRTLNYYNNILESDKIYKPTQVAYYLHELKFHIYDTKANCYEVDKMYFFKFVEIFVDLYMYVFKTSSLEETITKVMVKLSTDINNEKTKKNRVHLTKILKEYVNKNRKK